MRIRTALAGIAAAVLTTTLAVTPAGADSMPWKWNKRTIDVYVDSSVSPRWHVGAAITDWNDAAGLNVRRTYDKSKAEVIIRQKVIPHVNGGYTVSTLTPDSKWLVKADITLGTWALVGDYCYRRYLSRHELGHALGQAHNERWRKSTMYVNNNRICQRALTAWDERELQRQYPVWSRWTP